MDLQRKIISLHRYKRSVTSAEEAFVNQRLVHDRGHFAKQLKKAVQRHEAKRLSVNELHFLFDFFQLSEKRLYRLKSLIADIQ